jgi:hypothetical protein
MFIYRICYQLSSMSKMEYFSVNHSSSDEHYLDFQTVDLTAPDLWKNKRRCCLAPLRQYAQIPGIEDASIILHLRDPRDVLTSLYFSYSYSHPKVNGWFEPTKDFRRDLIEKGIDRFILEKDQNGISKAEVFLTRYQQYCSHLLDKPNVVFVKYEEMVSNFPDWLSRVLTPFEIPDKKKNYEFLLKCHKNEFKVKTENRQKHKRKITPGDYKEKLSEETIRTLNEMFRDVLIRLNYDI